MAMFNNKLLVVAISGILADALCHWESALCSNRGDDPTDDSLPLPAPELWKRCWFHLIPYEAKLLLQYGKVMVSCQMFEH